jgi:hypothetical protein
MRRPGGGMSAAGGDTAWWADGGPLRGYQARASVLSGSLACEHGDVAERLKAAVC